MALFFPRDLVTAATVGDVNGVATLFLCLTHIPLLYAGIDALVRSEQAPGLGGLFTLGLVVVCETFCSLLYHLCRGGVVCLGLTLDEWRKVDHTGVLLLGGTLGLFLLGFAASSRAGRRFYRAMQVILFFYTMIVVRAHPYQAQSILLLLVYVLVAALVRFLLVNPAHDLPPSGLYHVGYLVGGLVPLAAGAALYFINDGDLTGATVTEAVTHSLHHVLNGVAVWLETRALRATVDIL